MPLKDETGHGLALASAQVYLTSVEIFGQARDAAAFTPRGRRKSASVSGVAKRMDGIWPVPVEVTARTSIRRNPAW